MTQHHPTIEPLARRLAGRIPDAAWSRLFQDLQCVPVWAERKTLTVLFVDADAHGEALPALEEELSRLMPRYRGTRDHFSPTGVLVFFEHAALGVAMAMALQREVGHLRLRMGITTASCQVARLGVDGAEVVTLLGAESELASHVAASATCGSILISPSTYALVRDAVHADARDCLLAEEYDPLHGPTASITPTPTRGGPEASTFAGLGTF